MMMHCVQTNCGWIIYSPCGEIHQIIEAHAYYWQYPDLAIKATVDLARCRCGLQR